MLEFLSILAVGLAGGALPLLFRWGHRQFHAALALSSGVFLGAVFLHLLPLVGATADLGHARLVFGPDLSGQPLGLPATHDHDGDGVPDHLAAPHRGQPIEPVTSAPPASAAAPPEAGAGTAAPASPGHGHSHGTGVWLWVLLGVVGVYLVEALAVPGHQHHPHQHGCAPEGGASHAHGHDHGHDHGHTHAPRGTERRESQRHRAVGWAAFIGLSVHSLTSGVALAAVAEDAAIAQVMLWAILAHKGFESFSLASVFSMTARAPREVFALVVAFSCVTPLGLLLGHQVTALFGTGGIAVLTALAAGTFLYVCIGELLPEVFHHREDVLLKVALLGAGVGGMYLVHTLGGA